MFHSFVSWIWLALFLFSLVAPMRWSIVAFLCLSVVDFESGRSGIGSLNTLKGLVLPLFLLWRLRRYSGHSSLPLAPVAWLLFVCYVGIAGTWSLFPGSSNKLVAQLAASLIIACVLMRATKGGFLDARTAVATAIGCLALGILRAILYPQWAELGRFTAFTTAQAYASLLAALFCIVLCGRGLRTSTRVVVCSALAIGIVMNGSRIWFIGIIIASLLSLLLSRGQAWLKICAFATMVALLALVTGASDDLFRYLATGASQNRIASAVTALHEGDVRAAGLGTFNFRRAIIAEAVNRIKNSRVTELVFGRGTCNGAMITGTLFESSYRELSDPNRMFHNEWLRVIYEWGLIGTTLWVLFFGSIVNYAIKGVKIDPEGDAKPLLVYLPAFMFGLAGENIIAGADTAANVGFIFAIALSTLPHRKFLTWKFARAAKAAAYNRLLLQRRPAAPRLWNRTSETGPAPIG